MNIIISRSSTHMEFSGVRPSWKWPVLQMFKLFTNWTPSLIRYVQKLQRRRLLFVKEKAESSSTQTWTYQSNKATVPSVCPSVRRAGNSVISCCSPWEIHMERADIIKNAYPPVVLPFGEHLNPTCNSLVWQTVMCVCVCVDQVRLPINRWGSPPQISSSPLW